MTTAPRAEDSERRAHRTDRGRLLILATVTFNPNQLRAHLEPILGLEEVTEIVLVSDVMPPELPKLRGVVPSRTLSRLLGRAGAKLVTCCVLARRLRPDWVVGFNLVPHGLNAVASARVARARSIYVMIGGPVEWEEGGWRSDNKVLGRIRRRSSLLEKLLLAAARRATVTVAMGSRAREALLARGFDRSRVDVIPASVDESRFHPPAQEKKWDAIAVAELIPTKQLHDFVEAIAGLVPGRPEFRAAIVGEGPEREALEGRARALGIADRVELLGFRPDVEDIYAQASVYVLPSRYEGLSVSLLEAMASGLPVVASDVGEARDVVRHGDTGFLYPVGDVEALTRFLSSLLDDPDLRTRVGDEAARAARAYAGRAVIAARYRALLSADR
jgi:glycosyltransferase involved in cell wall biosynthesis